MRTLLVLSLIMSFSAFAQTRVRENIKQQAVSSSDDQPSTEQVKQEKGKMRSGKKKTR